MFVSLKGFSPCSAFANFGYFLFLLRAFLLVLVLFFG